MNIYQIKIQEVLARLVTIKAESKQDALDAIEHLYDNANIVLNADDLAEEATIECEDEWKDDGTATYDASYILKDMRGER